MPTETFEQFIQTVAKCHKLVELSPALMLSLFLDSLDKSRALSTKYSSSQQEASRPFDCGQERFLIGEGSVVIVLQEIEHAKKRGAKVYAELCGYGIMKSSWHLGDAHHITQPPEDGKGAILAMIGEGSVVIVLKELEHAKRRGAKVYAELCGYGIMKSSWHLGDPHHITQPPEDGKGAVLAMSLALRHVN
ncbi:hypothetical protein F2Q69_00035220 [Brassica cretica]|uniref:beta-ketoacyl-[acyl-carrier-protein] synthase I n=1 Tax=Brassica cretica TaxID=69181 RepID=A0A8S9SLW9_BRACR|nr:hypothetical protein F2Q69_00035220 [Brassica cretica]